MDFGLQSDGSWLFERLENFWCSVTVRNCVTLQELGPFIRGRDNVFGIITHYGLGRSGDRIPMGASFFRQSLGPTQPPM